MTKINILANYIGQIYVMSIGILVMPLYLQYLGAEAYGLVGFFIMMQVWLNLLDAGFAPTFGRQVAEARGDNSKFNNLLNLLRSVEIIFFIFSLCIMILIFNTSEWLSKEWIQADNLNNETIQYCFIIMGIIISLRWFTTIYRSGINGFEDQVWLNVINILINSFKYLGALALLTFISKDIRDFFNYQLFVGILELLILLTRMYSLLPKNKKTKMIIKIDVSEIKKILPFTLSIGYTTIIWTFLMQFDKLILSHILSLREYGYFSIIVLVSGALVSVATPIFLAILPRMTMLLAKDDLVEMKLLYKKMTQLVTWIVFSSSLIICIFSEPILYILLGDIEAVSWSVNILQIYILGYAFYVLGTFQYYLQNAYGNLKLYTNGASILAIFQVPIMYYMIIEFGAIGSSYVWLIFNIIWFLIFTFIVHSKFMPFFHLKWILTDILPIMFSILLLSFIIYQYINFSLQDDGKLVLLLKIFSVGVIFMLISSFSVPSVREYIINLYQKLKRSKIE